jgi:TRAP-type mannitol/chloroaromatic compound transport system substrate-binding protein
VVDQISTLCEGLYQPGKQFCFKAAEETYAEEAAKNPQFKKIFEDYRVFRNMEAQWFGLAELAFAQYSFAKKL